jgi:hypothetical protein
MPLTKNQGLPAEKVKRRSSDPYTINLDNQEYILTEEILKQNVSRQVLNQRIWHYPDLKFTSFTGGFLELKNACLNICHKLIIYIEKDRLKIHCSCDEEVEMLCRHAYKALERLIVFENSRYFQQYRPNGLYDITTTHRKYFAIKRGRKGLEIIPKDELGRIYQLNKSLRNDQVTEILKLPAKIRHEPKQLKDMALTYIVMASHRNRLLPFLLPCLGKLTKSGTSIKGFMNFISGTQKEYDQFLKEGHRVLNKSCYNMWKAVEKLPGSIINEEYSEDDSEKIKLVFDIWQSIIPLLWDEPFVFNYHLYGERELKRKPARHRIAQTQIDHNHPVLRFRLTDKGPFYQLSLTIFIKNTEVKNYELEPTFFISTNKKLYFLSSLRDAAIAEWMREMENKLTIFKEHFPEFETSILKQLRQHYDIEIVQLKMK